MLPCPSKYLFEPFQNRNSCSEVARSESLVGYVSIETRSLLPPVRLGPPCRRPILIATKYLLFRGQDTTRCMAHCSTRTETVACGWFRDRTFVERHNQYRLQEGAG
jgi:hypothetical protein